VNRSGHVDKVVITILLGSVVTQTVLGGLNIHSAVTNFIQFTCANNYGNWLRVNKVTNRVQFFWPTRYTWSYVVHVLMHFYSTDQTSV